MPKSKYAEIYRDLRQKIEEGVYERDCLLPSENELIQIYDCSRNTVRRAISCLNDQAYTQSAQGKGVRVIYTPTKQQELIASGITGLKQLAQEMGYELSNKVITFTDMTVDEPLSKKTNFEIGTKVYFIQRVRYLDGVAKMIDITLMRKDMVPGLSEEVLQKSLFEYIEKDLHMPIGTIKRRITVEHATPFDKKHLELNDYDCLAVITSHVYNASGVQFEFTISRNRPDIFAFNSVITRNSTI